MSCEVYGGGLGTWKQNSPGYKCHCSSTKKIPPVSTSHYPLCELVLLCYWTVFYFSWCSLPSQCSLSSTSLSARRGLWAVSSCGEGSRWARSSQACRSTAATSPRSAERFCAASARHHVSPPDEAATSKTEGKMKIFVSLDIYTQKCGKKTHAILHIHRCSHVIHTS